MAQVIGPGLHIRELGHRALQILSARAERLVSRDPGVARWNSRRPTIRIPRGPHRQTIADWVDYFRFYIPAAEFIFLLWKVMSTAYSILSKKEAYQLAVGSVR
jgi:hypothetical protein